MKRRLMITIWLYQFQIIPLNNKALILNDLELYEEAIELCDLVIEIGPTYMAAYYNRAEAYSALEDYEVNALQDYSKRMELDPNNAWNYEYRADCYQQ